MKDEPYNLKTGGDQNNMLDFVTIESSYDSKKGTTIYPEFIVGQSKDLMIRGHSFYAVWDEERGLWSTDERDIQRIVDQMTFEHASKITDDRKTLKLLKNFSTNKWREWQQFCKSFPDSYEEVDAKIIFSNQNIKKDDYVTRSLPYPLKSGKCNAYNRLMSVIYDPEEREKLEWAVGAIISGDSKWIQKFIVLYGGSGTGKSTFLNILQNMFPGYYSLLDAKELGSGNSFSLESLKDNKLIAIQHDGDLSRIEDNTKLNSIVSHEEIPVNEKFKSIYKTRFRSFLFMGTNTPVKITDSKSGLLRRLIDVTPTGNKVPVDEYNHLMDSIKFEYSAIAYRCLQVYKKLGPHYYDKYVAVSMIQKTNDFYNFIEDNLDLFLNIDEENGLPLRIIWKRYKQYCEDANIKYPVSMRVFKDELKNYFEDFKERYGNQYSVYFGFLKNKFVIGSDTASEIVDSRVSILEKGEKAYEIVRTTAIYNNDSNSCDGYYADCGGVNSWLKFDHHYTDFDNDFAECPAQYSNSAGTPSFGWDICNTKLKDLDTKKVHYVRVPENLIVIDFDLKNEKGEKDYNLNLEAASKWPQTYAELSKSECGIHLHYWYDGDPKDLSRIFDENIEIKVFSGKSSLRRCLTRCNDIPIAHISSGLPIKEKRSGSMITDEKIRSERSLRDLIKRNLKKEIHPGTKPSIDFIHKILEDCYNQGLKYDVTDLRPAIQNFAMNSTHQSDYCLRLVGKMKFKSEDISDNVDDYSEEAPIIFFDVEVFPNLFIVAWKKQGKNCKPVRLINPLPEHIEELCKNRLVGFNNRDYDNHILYARMMGYSNEQLFKLSQRIIVEKDKDAKFGEAYNLSYTDIYDFLSASNKMSLKKWEIKLGIHHHELGMRWDQPVPEDKWEEVADYCLNDVIATEAVWDANQEDWMAREILADLAGMTVNDTTNTLTTRIIVGKDKNPQDKFIYTDLSTIFPGYEYNEFGIDLKRYKEGTKIVSGKSIYKGVDPGEGGRVYAQPGMYFNVGVLDVMSMHPHSLIRLKVFGEEYTARFQDIVIARILIKHKQYDEAKTILDGKLAKYLDDPKTAKKLANALKTAINSVYGLTSAKFPNKLRDPRNKDNIVAKYGALFMINLQEEVEKRGYTVVHIKTDSIKIANIDQNIIDFVMGYGREYGFTFEYETKYSKMCLVNESTYIAEVCEEDGEPVEKRYWTATGAQFQVPYVFKTLFSKESIEFSDLCETKSVTTAMYLDFNEDLSLPFLDDGTGNIISPPEDSPLRHDYHFVGKVGLFCPIKDGCGGAVLLREGSDGKYSSVVGTKRPGGKDVYRWMEADMVKSLGLEKDIDLSYYNHLVDDAVETISKFGDFERFVNEEIIGNSGWWMNIPNINGDEVPFEEVGPDKFPMNEPVNNAA